jgi:hypothetical protein
MCLPVRPDQPRASSSSQGHSIVGLGVAMLLACLAGPAIAGAVGALGVGVLVSASGGLVAITLCAAVPAAALAGRRRAGRRAPTAEL